LPVKEVEEAKEAKEAATPTVYHNASFLLGS
jgi:hypothetical protein